MSFKEKKESRSGHKTRHLIVNVLHATAPPTSTPTRGEPRTHAHAPAGLSHPCSLIQQLSWLVGHRSHTRTVAIGWCEGGRGARAEEQPRKVSMMLRRSERHELRSRLFVLEKVGATT